MLNFTLSEVTLQYEVSLNGVREDVRHVLNSEIAKYGELTPEQITILNNFH